MSVMITAIVVGLLGVDAVLLSAILARLNTTLRRYRYTPPAETLEHLPSVSVCIPARNETHAMTECLERVLASNYQKLEVIVLDDSSVDDTSMLIKSFAHAGVRFVEGSVLPDGWLGKNHALEGLLKESSSSYVLFLGVDTILKPDSIGKLVTWAEAHNQSFVSVLPQRADGYRLSVIFGSLRYLWSLILDSKQTPAAGSSTWLVNRQKLIDAGGFSKYKTTTQPEVQLALALDHTEDQVLLVGNDDLGVSYEKKWHSQAETSIRLLKDVFGGYRNTITLSVAVGFIGFLPIVALIVFSLQGNYVGIVLALVDWLLLSLIFACYFKSIWRQGWWLGLLHWPLLIAQEIILMILSVVQYIRGSVIWKGRSVSNAAKRH